MNAPAVILDAFKGMSDRLSSTVGSGFMPHRYHAKRGVAEANSLYQFLKALEARLLNPRVYLESTFDEGRLDAVVASQSSLFLIEAKATIFSGSANGILGSLETQASRMSDPKLSLHKYLTTRIIETFKGEEWGRCAIKETWGIVIADTLEQSRKTHWGNLSTSDFPTLRTYETHVRQAGRHAGWWHLIGFTKIPALSEAGVGPEMQEPAWGSTRITTAMNRVK